MSEYIVHGWLWRTGVANLVGTVAAVAHVDATVAIPAVTSALTGLVGQAAVALGLAAGIPRRPRWPGALAAVAVVLSAAPVFLGWQHLLGQLSPFALFPDGLALIARASLTGV